ncbi:hypothetical protein NT6N_22130 [Oceaniferula spumae]|uniref:SCP domain-containing protein n=1 Tax=Oceaniferula spumae TaxID=2979115 RepID=A0AAT9FMJ2_9BACT
MIGSSLPGGLCRVQRLVLASVLCSLLASCGSAKKSNSKYVITVPQGYSTGPRSAEQDISILHQLMNQTRRAKGRSLLVIDPRLMRAAQEHSEAMNRHNELTHQTRGERDFQKRLMKQGYPQSWCAENIAQAPNAELTHRLWTESPGHLKNLLGKKYTRVGIGRSGQYWTANYAAEAGGVTADGSIPAPAVSTSYRP